MGGAASHAVVGPRFGQIQVHIDRKLLRARRDRQTGSHLAIARLSQGAAVLPLHPGRLIALLWKACVVHDPRFDRLSRRHRFHGVARRVLANRWVQPLRLRYEIQEALGVCAAQLWISASPSRDRFDALALPLAEKPHRIHRKRLATTPTPEPLANLVKIPRQTVLSGPIELVSHPPCSHQRAKRANKTGQ